jgi:hypothetical protein
MVMHKHIRLTPHDRQKIWQLWQTGEYKVSRLAELFRGNGRFRAPPLTP